jgi:anaerobic magnesium-protoporphyrin IX monomethyl ester cyclase
MKVLFIEPPKDIWFIMGEYLPPPYGIIQLASVLEREIPDLEIEVLDCNAEQIHWGEMERRISVSTPDVVASSALSTCNTYAVARTLQTAKKIDSSILTITGGQHFTATAHESMKAYPEIDVIIRGEGERTLTELVKKADNNASLQDVKGISYRKNGETLHNPCRPLIEDLNDLPFPGYHFVEHLVHKYHFAAMAGKSAPYALIEGSRGCTHRCTFCTQWSHWNGRWRAKSPSRIADEMKYCHEKFGSEFIWLTDDNFGFGRRGGEIADKILENGFAEEFLWFTQARCDDVIKSKNLLPKLRKSGLRWVLLGVESSKHATLETYKKKIEPEDAYGAVKLLQENDIFAQTMFIIGERKDTYESIEHLRNFANSLDPDFAIFAILTPFPGTKLFEEAKKNSWIEDTNWSNYDMVHAIMPTETLSIKEVQEELYKCYRSFYGSWNRRIRGVLSRNRLKRRIFWYMTGRGIIRELRSLFQILPEM